MENDIKIPSHESAPSFSKSSLKYPCSSNFFSSVTHPSVQSRNTDDIFKRIRSGKDILCKLPTRLNPNIQFSDDEEDDTEDVKTKEAFNKLKPVEKTPELPSKHLQLFGTNNKNDIVLDGRRTVDSTPLPSFPIQRFSSACKPSSSRSNIDIQNLLPQSENKIFKKTQLIPDKHKYTQRNMMSESQLKSLQSNNLFAKPQTVFEEVLTVNGKTYSVLKLLGSGGSCKVYSVLDSEKKTFCAIKRVDLRNADPSIQDGYRKEIEYLKKLQGSLRVIKMHDYEYHQEEILLVLEHGDIDFAKYISNEAKLKRLTPLMIKFYWSQMLEAVADIHKYGIVHSDLKPANFLLVEGNLKLIDFGIATSVPEDKTSTFRETQVGTLNYMSPEAITQLSSVDNQRAYFKVGVKSDVWSLGCILYNLVYGFTPFQHLKNYMQKIHAIMNPNCEIVFKDLSDKYLLDVMKQCLKRDPKERASVIELLSHPYLTESKEPVHEEPSKSDNQFKTVLEQMQGFTPRRMNYIKQMVQELSQTKIN